MSDDKEDGVGRKKLRRNETPARNSTRTPSSNRKRVREDEQAEYRKRLKEGAPEDEETIKQREIYKAQRARQIEEEITRQNEKMARELQEKQQKEREEAERKRREEKAIEERIEKARQEAVAKERERAEREATAKKEQELLRSPRPTPGRVPIVPKRKVPLQTPVRLELCVNGED